MESDPRIPVYLDPREDPAVIWATLIEVGMAAPLGPCATFTLAPSLHGLACACCQPRGAVATALAQLFARRARGEVPFFAAVRVLTHSMAGRDAARAAVAEDVLARARFRLAE